MDCTKVWLIGTSQMGQDYAKVLKALSVPFEAIGRGKSNCKIFKEKIGVVPFENGIADFINKKKSVPEFAIVAVGVEVLSEVTKILLKHGVRQILVEKPGVCYLDEIDEICNCSHINNANCYIAYNRRFYASVRHVRKMANLDGGIKSMHFEFTEWSHVVEQLKLNQSVLQNWFLVNSSHVIDTAFFLSGNPVEMSCFTRGSLAWHTSASIFSGAGITDSGVVFSYQANWSGPGRWGIDIISPLNRYILRPLEKLYIQKIGSLNTEVVEIDDLYDIDYKPGLYLQTEAFLNHRTEDLINDKKQQRMMHGVYKKMSGY